MHRCAGRKSSTKFTTFSSPKTEHRSARLLGGIILFLQARLLLLPGCRPKTSNLETPKIMALRPGQGVCKTSWPRPGNCATHPPRGSAPGRSRLSLFDLPCRLSGFKNKNKQPLFIALLKFAHSRTVLLRDQLVICESIHCCYCDPLRLYPLSSLIVMDGFK